MFIETDLSGWVQNEITNYVNTYKVPQWLKLATSGNWIDENIYKLNYFKAALIKYKEQIDKMSAVKLEPNWLTDTAQKGKLITNAINRKLACIELYKLHMNIINNMLSMKKIYIGYLTQIQREFEGKSAQGLTAEIKEYNAEIQRCNRGASIMNFPILGGFLQWTQNQGWVNWDINQSPEMRKYVVPAGIAIAGIVVTVMTAGVGGVLAPAISSLAGGVVGTISGAVAKKESDDYFQRIKDKGVNEEIAQIEKARQDVATAQLNLGAEDIKEKEILAQAQLKLENDLKNAKIRAVAVPVGVVGIITAILLNT